MSRFFLFGGIIVSLIVVGVIIFLVLFFNSKSPPPSPSPSVSSTPAPPFSSAPLGSSVTLREPWSFYLRTNKPRGLDGPEGRDKEGALFDKTGTKIEEGFGTASSLAQYPLTYAFGHEYWKPGSYGFLTGPGWGGHLARFPPQNRLSNILDVPVSKTQVLVVEARSVTRGEYDYAPVVLDMSLDVAGIVVRHGGILLVDDADLTIRTQFVLVESGGLFQAGSSSTASFRFQSNLDIVLTHPGDGYLSMGAVGSQYSSRVYHPGSTGATYTGLPAESNSFGAKVIGVGFNGNLTLAGNVPAPAKYMGTWECVNAETETPWLSHRDLLTWFDPDDPDEVAKAAQHNIETAYPTTWARLSNDFFSQGETEITVSPRDPIQSWPQGSQIVITAKTKQYSVYPVDPQGLVPVWVDNDDPDQRNANQEANERFVARFATSPAQKDTGVEVARIKRVEGSTIWLEDPLRFNHDSRHSVIQRTNQEGVKTALRIGDGLHVGLLTRPIRIMSDLTSGGEGSCNIIKSAAPGYGPGGSVMCNTDQTAQEWTRLQEGRSQTQFGSPKGTADEPPIFLSCYKDIPPVGIGGEGGNFCNQEEPSPVEEGHWMFGTQGAASCNAILGGHQMFRMGASVEQDGVEVKYMGTPGNFGLVGRYAVHFHLTGFAPLLQEYLPATTSYGAFDPAFHRVTDIANSSNWCSLSRWYVMHGSHLCNFKNNVSFVCYGSGFFVEDGTEINNTMEHNLAVYNLLSNYDSYYNPTPIYPKVVSDLCMSSVFWLKNNQNRVFRCVASNSPTPIVGIWNVPQKIGDLRGSSTLCVGDAALKLPALGGGQTSPDGTCWTPPYFETIKAYAMPESSCLAFSSENNINPYSLFAENIFYQMFGAQSEFPEAVEAHPANWDGTGSFFGCPSLHYNFCAAHPEECGGVPGAEWVPGKQQNWIPQNGQNSCTDERAQSIYFQTTWGGGDCHAEQCDPFNAYAYQPLASDKLSSYNGRGLTRSETQLGNLLPKLFSGWLTYNLGTGGTLWGGVSWLKQAPGWVFNSCFLETSIPGEMMTVANGRDANNNPPAYLPAFSTMFQMSSGGNGTQAYAAVFPVMYNFITNGGITWPSNPTIMGGEKFFVSDSAQILASEYNNLPGAINNAFFIDLLDSPVNIIPATLWTEKNIESAETVKAIGLYDLDRENIWTVPSQSRDLPRLVSSSSPLYQTFFSTSPSRKFPYVCGDDGRLFRVRNGRDPQFGDTNPQWNDIVVNSQTQSLINTYAIGLGDKICQALSRIPPCYTSVGEDISSETVCCYPGDTCA